MAKRTLNPVWNHTFTYEDVSLAELSERALELTIWDHDRLASNEFLGGVRLSLGTGKWHWTKVTISVQMTEYLTKCRFPSKWRNIWLNDDFGYECSCTDQLKWTRFPWLSEKSNKWTLVPDLLFPPPVEIGKYFGKSVDWLDSTGKELTIWQSMVNRPNFWVEGCIILRSSLDNVRNTY